MIISVFDTPSCLSQVVWRQRRTERAPSDFSENFSDMFFVFVTILCIIIALLYPLGPAIINLSTFLRPFSRIINENLRIMHVFLRLQPWILDFAKILHTRATSGSAGT